MEERKRNRNALRSKKLIHQAFTELLQEKALENITVTDIAKRAEINRTTFYCHYNDIYALLNEMFQEATDHHIAVIQQNPYRNLIKDPTPYLQMLNRLILENLELLRSIVKTDYAQKQIELLLNRLIEDIVNAPDVPEHIRRNMAFRTQVYLFCSGMLGVYKKWFDGALECSLEEISQIIAQSVTAVSTACGDDYYS